MIFQNLNLNQPSRENSVSYESVKRQKMDISVHLNYVVAESILSTEFGENCTDMKRVLEKLKRNLVS
ncbi:hypothetical protein OIU78_015704 [Salix suchowensis]|nr:hypothetical protein OIU78_015704 [Salix suchowensis]